MLNVAFAIQAEAMDEKEFKAFTRELPLDPTGKEKRNRGMGDLVRMMGGARSRPPDMPAQPPKSTPAPEAAT